MIGAARTGVTAYSTPSDRQIMIVRVVDAPRHLVWDAWTDPKHIPNWLAGEGMTMSACDVDLRPGGKWRFVYGRDSKIAMTLSGTYREVSPPERLVSSESWGPEWPETVNTMVLTELAGQTTITITVTYPSMEARDAALQTGMKSGMDQGFAKLDALLGTLVLRR